MASRKALWPCVEAGRQARKWICRLPRHSVMPACILIAGLLAIFCGEAAVAQDAAASIETKILKDVVSVHVGSDDYRHDTFRYSPPDGYHIKDYQVLETSKFGDASYTVSFQNDVLSIPWEARSHEKKALGVVVDTNTASLHLNVSVRLEPNPKTVSTPSDATPSLHVPASTSDAKDPHGTGQKITATGILCLGILVGLIAALALFRARSVGLKIASGVLGLMLTGAPISFLPSGAWLRFVYPIGLLLGVLALRLIRSRLEFATDRETRRRFALIDTVAIVVIMIVAFVLVVMAV